MFAITIGLDKVVEVDVGLIECGTWIKETYSTGDEENGLDGLTITKSNPNSGHVYYVIL